MQRWAVLTVLLYAAVLVALVAPVSVAAFGRWEVIEPVYSYPPLWVWLELMVISQYALLALPVRMTQARPITKIWIFWPIAATIVATCVLAVGMGFVAFEIVWRLVDPQGNGEPPPVVWFGVAGVAVFWIAWAFVFGFYAGRTEPQGLMRRIVRWLVAGSVLELLVAIPAHVYTRSKDSCCGGIYTVWGLAAGIAVMLFAFGPGVFLLFLRRLNSLRSK